MCVWYIHIYMHMCGGKHREARSHSCLSSLSPFTLAFRGSLIKTDAHRLPSLADQQASGICLTHPSSIAVAGVVQTSVTCLSHSFIIGVAGVTPCPGIWTQFFTLAQKALCTLNHLPSPPQVFSVNLQLVKFYDVKFTDTRGPGRHLVHYAHL